MSFRIPKSDIEKALTDAPRLGHQVKAYLSLGSNDGDRHANLDKAIAELEKSDNITLLKSSDYYLSEPVKTKTGEKFLNCVVEVETLLEPLELLDSLEDIETDFGRTGKGMNIPRAIDIDIIFYGDMVVAFPRLKVPHPRMAERRFVLEPLAQITPDFKHPILKKTPIEMMAMVSQQVVFREQLEKTGL